MNTDVALFIPVKKYSTRVENKNFKPFYKTSNLLEIKLRQALRLFSSESVIVTTDSEEALQIADHFGVRSQFIPALSHFEWNESVKALASECHKPFLCIYRATTPFLDEHSLNHFLDHFFSDDDSDSALTVLKIQERLFNSKFRPLNFSIGAGHLDSQDTPPIYKEVCGISIISKELATSYAYHYGKKPKLVMVDQLHGIDINTEEEWQMAQVLTEIPSFSNSLQNTTESPIKS